MEKRDPLLDLAEVVATLTEAAQAFGNELNNIKSDVEDVRGEALAGRVMGLAALDLLLLVATNKQEAYDGAIGNMREMLDNTNPLTPIHDRDLFEAQINRAKVVLESSMANLAAIRGLTYVPPQQI